MNEYDYVQEHFEELAATCPGLTIERVLQGAVRLIRVFGEPKGFISLEPGEKALHVIALFIEKGAPRGLSKRVIEETLEYGKAFDRIEFDTTRKGWLRKLAGYGFEPMPYFRMVRSNHG